MSVAPPLTECKAWSQLAQHAESWRSVHLRDLFANDVTRSTQLVAEAPGLRYDYSRQRVGAITLRLLARLAEERGFAEWRESLLTGKPINSTENRAAWHTALRAGAAAPAEVKQALSTIKILSEKLRTEKTIKRIVNLGTGGSDLGPRLVADALSDGKLDVRFAANVDPADLQRALAGVWNSNFLGAVTHAVLPYSNALRLLPSYLQQLEMESNGKRVDREGREVQYATAPVLWGAEGTVSQHSFHQLLHQGTQVVPVDFINFDFDKALAANCIAQADALAFGTNDAALPPHKRYPGNRPSSVLHMQAVTPRNLGRLLALYEHKVFTQGVIWNINSFDQWGVELGKQLANRILKGER